MHQFCRVGRHAFIGGYSVVTKDALPFAKTVGSRALCRVYGLNTIGLMRRGFSSDTLDEAEARLSLPAAVEAECDAGAAARSRAIRAGLSRSRVPGRLHPHRLARRHPQARQGRLTKRRRTARRRMKLGLIAGNGRFPFLVLDAARALGHDVTIVAIKEEAFPDLEDGSRTRPARPLHWVSLGHLGNVPQACSPTPACTQAVMAGQVKHTKIFERGLPDLTMLSVLTRLRARNTDAVIAAVADVMRERGIELLDSTALLRAAARAAPGVLTRRAPTDDGAGRPGVRLPDGRRDRRARHRPDHRVKHQAVVAVEAMEGTDETIARAGRLAGPGVVSSRWPSPNQDMRFDVPVVGLATIQAMREPARRVLSIDAGKTLMFDGDALFASADEAGIVVGRRRRGHAVRVAVVGVGHLGPPSRADPGRRCRASSWSASSTSIAARARGDCGRARHDGVHRLARRSRLASTP